MTASPPFDFNAGSAERLRWLLDMQGVPNPDRFKQSIVTAGAVLDGAKVGVLHPSYMGDAVMYLPGTAMIVVAHRAKAMTIWMRPHGCTFGTAIEELVASFNALHADRHGAALPVPSFAKAAVYMVKLHGRPAGQPGPDLDDEHNGRMIGMLCAALPEEGRAHLAKGLEILTADGICPALMCLIGKGTETGTSGVWPIVMPLAPYADTAVAA